MSCTICRLPFVPGPGSTDPYPQPPTHVLNPSQYIYLSRGVGLGRRIIGVYNDFEYFGSNMFGCHAPVLQTIIWESPGGTFVMAHTTCGAILRRVLDAEANTVNNLTKIASLEIVLGRPQSGRHAGRFKDVDYERGVGDKVDLRPFWTPANDIDAETFEWNDLLLQGLEWTLSRPNVFPKFFAIVSAARLPCNAAVDFTGVDVITNQPLDIIHVLISFLSIESYVFLTSTCRYLRNLALTLFQPHTRRLVLTLPWAIPLQSEYVKLKSYAPHVAHGEASPHDGDWMLYLSHVHRTQSMRVRRWIWNLCVEIKRVYEVRKEEVMFDDQNWEELEKEIGRLWDIT